MRPDASLNALSDNRKGPKMVNKVNALTSVKYLKFKLVLASLSLFFAATYVAWFWYDHFNCSPQELYHRTWKSCRDNIFDPTELKNWDAWEHKFDGKIKTNKDAVDCANKMLSSIGDPYTYMMDTGDRQQESERRDGKFVGLGIGFYTSEDTKKESSRKINQPEDNQYLVVKWIMPNSPAERAGVRRGDTILGIAGKVAKGMTAMQLSAISRVRQNQQTPLTIKRYGRIHRLVMVPLAIPLQNVEHKQLASGVGYLKIRDFIQKDTPASVSKALKKLESCRSLIIDLRDNPGGSVGECLEVATMFMDKGPLVTLKCRQTAGSYYTESYALIEKYVTKTVRDQSGVEVITRMNRRYSSWQSRPIVILINKGTASCAEMLSACLKDNGRAKLVGTTTLGKGIAQTHLPMPNETAFSITCVHYFTPNGYWLGTGRKGLNGSKLFDKEGLKPNLVVNSTKTYDTTGSDDCQFNRALQLLSRNKFGEVLPERAIRKSAPRA
jgi:Periplasmic protease